MVVVITTETIELENWVFNLHRYIFYACILGVILGIVFFRYDHWLEKTSQVRLERIEKDQAKLQDPNNTTTGNNSVTKNRFLFLSPSSSWQGWQNRNQQQ